MNRMMLGGSWTVICFSCHCGAQRHRQCSCPCHDLMHYYHSFEPIWWDTISKSEEKWAHFFLQECPISWIHFCKDHVCGSMTWALINLVDFFVLANFKCVIKQRRLLCRSFCLVGKNNKVSCATAESKSLSSSFGSEAVQHFLWAWLVEAIMPAQRSWSKFCPCCRRSLLSLHSTPWLLNNRLQKKKIFLLKWFCCQLGLPIPGSVLLWKWCGRDLRLRTLTDLLKPWLPAASFVFRSLCKPALVQNSVLLWSELCRLFFEAVQDLCQLGKKSEEVSRGFLDCHKFLILFFSFFCFMLCFWGEIWYFKQSSISSQKE